MSINPNTQYTLSGSQITDLRDYVQAAMESPSTLLGSTAPSSSTAADVGQLYLNTTNDKVYICTAKTSQGGTPETFTYTWEEIGGSGGGVTITMTPTDPGEGSALAAGNYVAVYGGDPIIEDYSTLEVNTGAKWIDGAVVYKKTINLGSLPNNTAKAVAHSISNLDFVIGVQATASDGVNRIVIPATATTGTASQVAIYIDSTNVNITSGVDRSGYYGYATLYYTKSS